MAVNREKQFNNLQHIVGSMKNPEPKHLVEAQIATEFHKDKRQEELIDEVSEFKEQLSITTQSIAEVNKDLKSLKGAVDTLNTDTAEVYNRLYGRLNMLTTVMAMAAVVSCVALVIQVYFQITHAS